MLFQLLAMLLLWTGMSLNEKFSETEEKCNFRRSNRIEKLRNMAYGKGINYNIFIHELKICIKELSFVNFMAFSFSRKFSGVFRKDLK